MRNIYSWDKMAKIILSLFVSAEVQTQQETIIKEKKKKPLEQKTKKKSRNLELALYPLLHTQIWTENKTSLHLSSRS